MTAHEALGLLLLELGRPGEAFAAFEASLRGAKNRLRSYAGAAAAAAAAGNTAAARSYYGKVLELADGGHEARAHASQGLSAAGKAIAAVHHGWITNRPQARSAPSPQTGRGSALELLRDCQHSL